MEGKLTNPLEGTLTNPLEGNLANPLDVYHYRPNTMNTRTGFSCSMCGKLFPNRGKLTRHFIVHTGAKFYKCYICAREFGIKSSLKRHLLAIHKLPYEEPVLYPVETDNKYTNMNVQDSRSNLHYMTDK